jgi:hypothetical protein
MGLQGRSDHPVREASRRWASRRVATFDPPYTPDDDGRLSLRERIDFAERMATHEPDERASTPLTVNYDLLLNHASILRLTLTYRGDRCFCHSKIVVRRKQDLQTPHARRDRDNVPELGRLIEVDRVIFFAGQRRYSASDVTGQRLDVLEWDGVDLLLEAVRLAASV